MDGVCNETYEFKLWRGIGQRFLPIDGEPQDLQQEDQTVCVLLSHLSAWCHDQDVVYVDDNSRARVLRIVTTGFVALVKIHEADDGLDGRQLSWYSFPCHSNFRNFLSWQWREMAKCASFRSTFINQPPFSSALRSWSSAFLKASTSFSPRRATGCFTKPSTSVSGSSLVVMSWAICPGLATPIGVFGRLQCTRVPSHPWSMFGRRGPSAGRLLQPLTGRWVSPARFSFN